MQQASSSSPVSPASIPQPAKPPGSNFEAEARQAFKNLDAALRAGNSRLDLVVNTTVLLTDLANFPDLNRLFAEFFPASPPARMVMQVPLPKGLLISIGCVAATAD